MFGCRPRENVLHRWCSWLVLAVAVCPATAVAQRNESTRPAGARELPPLIAAAQRGDLARVKARLAQGDAVDLRDQFRSTALVEAAWAGQAEIVQLLIERGADVNAANQAGATALMGAAVQDHEALATVLLKAGARVDRRNEEGWTALDLAAHSDSARLIALLVQHGAKVDAQATNGSTPLVEAAARSQLGALKALLQAGADINGTDRKGATPLIAAAGNRRTEAVVELLKRGADATHADMAGDTALELARKRGDAALVALLTKAAKPPRPKATAPRKGGKKGRAAAPELVSSNVDGDERLIAPELTELVLSFDQPMNRRRYHLSQVDKQEYGVFPELTGDDPIVFRDERTLVLHVKLKPNARYGFGMNQDGRLEFRSAAGVPLEPLIFYFRTGGAGHPEKRRNNAPPHDGADKAPLDAETLLARLIAQPTKENYLAVHAFAIGRDTYKPYSSDVLDLADVKTEAACQKTLRTMDQAPLNLLFSPRAHLCAAMAAGKLGDTKRKSRELLITDRLIRGILATGDGTQQQPYRILRVFDEKDVLMHLEKTEESHSLVLEGGRFDVIRCTDGTSLWFDVSNIFGRF